MQNKPNGLSVALGEFDDRIQDEFNEVLSSFKLPLIKSECYYQASFDDIGLGGINVLYELPKGGVVDSIINDLNPLYNWPIGDVIDLDNTFLQANVSERKNFILPNVFYDLCTYDSLCYKMKNFKILLLSHRSEGIYRKK